MVQKFQRRLCGIAGFLNHDGKLEMAKSALSSLPMVYMCCLDIPITIKDQVVKYMRHYLWRKNDNDVQAQGKAPVAWNKICRPKNHGGPCLEMNTGDHDSFGKAAVGHFPKVFHNM
jgi:hypothetical protein